MIPLRPLLPRPPWDIPDDDRYSRWYFCIH